MLAIHEGLDLFPFTAAHPYRGLGFDKYATFLLPRSWAPPNEKKNARGYPMFEVAVNPHRVDPDMRLDFMEWLWHIIGDLQEGVPQVYIRWLRSSLEILYNAFYSQYEIEPRWVAYGPSVIKLNQIICTKEDVELLYIPILCSPLFIDITHVSASDVAVDIVKISPQGEIEVRHREPLTPPKSWNGTQLWRAVRKNPMPIELIRETIAQAIEGFFQKWRWLILQMSSPDF